ncbi:MAG: phosphatidylserine decarboxylase [Thermoplasmatota archaeon]
MLRIAHGGANWIVIPISLALLMVGLAGPLGMPWLVPLSGVPFFFTLFFLYFFRDPERPAHPEGLACPADGKVVRVDEVDDPDVGRAQRLSIFMRPSDVHVNRFPLDGDVRRVTHHAGKHVPAFNKDSHRNERVETLLATELGEVKVIQIAGAVARRIVPYAQPGDHVARGEKLGLIRLGSRCDLLIPVGKVAWTVEVGQRVFANRTKVAETT